MAKMIDIGRPGDPKNSPSPSKSKALDISDGTDRSNVATELDANVNGPDGKIVADDLSKSLDKTSPLVVVIAVIGVVVVFSIVYLLMFM